MLKKKLWRRFVLVGLLIILVVMVAVPASAQVSIDDARKSVVRVIALEPGWQNVA